MKFIHLTDPHFIPPGKTLYGRDPRIALDAAVADINAANSDAEHNSSLINFYLTFGDIMSTDEVIGCLKKNAAATPAAAE